MRIRQWVLAPASPATAAFSVTPVPKAQKALGAGRIDVSRRAPRGQEPVPLDAPARPGAVGRMTKGWKSCP
jgi:hypothetical protein